VGSGWWVLAGGRVLGPGEVGGGVGGRVGAGKRGARIARWVLGGWVGGRVGAGDMGAGRWVGAGC
jgi:hypothetical protein